VTPQDSHDGGDSRSSVVDTLATELRSRTLRGDLLPGDPLREQDLAAEFGVGRNSVRAALQLLTHEGLVVHRANRGAFVRQFGLDDIEDLYGLRTALECETARQVAHWATPLDEPRQLLKALEAFRPGSPWDEIVATDMAFHSSIVRLAGNPRIARLHHALTLEVQLLQSQVRFDYPEPGGQLGDQHRVLVEALESQDPVRAAEAFREHLDMSQREVAACYRNLRRRAKGASA
jgi:DNA-binding GntR family transcriptional regulator